MWRGLLPLFLTIVVLVLVCTTTCIAAACTAAEYQVKGECCPMCNPGFCVFRHCTEYTSTTCTPCSFSTYTDHHNGLESCKACTICDTSAGLSLKRECSPTSDTLCEPLEGFYCTDPIKDGCQGAVEHTMCSPGQFIQQNGTSSSDTVCEECTNNTYSDGTFTSCTPHTQCGWEQVVHKGTSSSDAKCGHGVKITITVIVVVMSIVLTTVICCIQRKCCSKRGEDAVARGRFMPMIATG